MSQPFYAGTCAGGAWSASVTQLIVYFCAGTRRDKKIQFLCRCSLYTNTPITDFMCQPSHSRSVKWNWITSKHNPPFMSQLLVKLFYTSVCVPDTTNHYSVDVTAFWITVLLLEVSLKRGQKIQFLCHSPSTPGRVLVGHGQLVWQNLLYTCCAPAKVFLTRLNIHHLCPCLLQHYLLHCCMCAKQATASMPHRGVWSL